MTRTSKRDLVKQVSERAGVTRDVAGDVFDALLAVLAEQLAKGNSVGVPGFGSWRTKVSAPRVAHDVRSGRRVAIPARTRVVFKAGAALKRATESSIDPRVFFGEGVAAAAEVDRAFASLFGDVAGGAAEQALDAVRARIREAIGPGAEREAFEFFEAMWQWKQVATGAGSASPPGGDAATRRDDEAAPSGPPVRGGTSGER